MHALSSCSWILKLKVNQGSRLKMCNMLDCDCNSAMHIALFTNHYPSESQTALMTFKLRKSCDLLNKVSGDQIWHFNAKNKPLSQWQFCLTVTLTLKTRSRDVLMDIYHLGHTKPQQIKIRNYIVGNINKHKPAIRFIKLKKSKVWLRTESKL